MTNMVILAVVLGTSVFAIIAGLAFKEYIMYWVKPKNLRKRFRKAISQLKELKKEAWHSK